jgi:hypothetical protein
VGQRALVLRVTTDKGSVHRQIVITRFVVAIVPNVTGHSPSDFFRFRLYGFHRGGSIYLHYVKPNGRLRHTVRLGRTRGSCGYLITGRRQLFPFSGRLARGNWHLQFDKYLRYSKTAKAPKARLRVPIL